MHMSASILIKPLVTINVKLNIRKLHQIEKYQQ